MRYIGSKALLLNELENLINSKVKTFAKSFCDIFSGTSVVARHFKTKFKIISNDILYFSYVLQQATIKNEVRPNFKELVNNLGCDPFVYFSKQQPSINDLEEYPFIYHNYSPNPFSERQYFSNQNALFIDFVRQSIEKWKNKKL